MRQRTKSVVNVREYFRMDGTGAPAHGDDLRDLDATLAFFRSSVDVLKPHDKTRARTSTCDSLAETDDDSDGEEDDGILRIRACSHSRRISFDDDVNVVEIPARSSFDPGYKHRVWYTRDELRQSQACC